MLADFGMCADVVVRTDLSEWIDGWLTTRIGSPEARADSLSVGAAASARARLAQEEGAWRHERKRHTHQTSGREAYAEPVDGGGLRVQKRANIVGAKGAVTFIIVFSSMPFQQEFLEARSRAVVFWSAMVAQIYVGR